MVFKWGSAKWCSNGVQMVFRQHQYRVVLKNTGIGCVQFTLSKEMESVRTEGAPGWHREESKASPDKFTQESCGGETQVPRKCGSEIRARAGRHSCCRRSPKPSLGASAGINHCPAAPLWRSHEPVRPMRPTIALPPSTVDEVNDLRGSFL